MHHLVHTFGHFLGGILLIAGTSIGVGMLALPVATAPGGFLPALVIYTLCWLFMMCTGLLILEVCTWMPKETNLITFTFKLLGKWGKASCWVLYLFLLSCLMIAHILAGGDIVALLSGGCLAKSLSTIFYVILFLPIVFLGTLWVDRSNIILMLGILITYLIFVFSSIGHIQSDLLARMDWKKGWLALPVLFTAFGYQIVIPTLFNYMKRNIDRMRLAIILGTTIPFVIYVIWELLILGIVPLEGSGGLIEALHKGENAITPLSLFIDNSTLRAVAQAFAFCAMSTSFLGISIAFVDFLADGLKMEKKGAKRVLLCAFVFVIPTCITLVNPNIFLIALSYAGGLGVALLLGALPIMMVWAGRYYHKYPRAHRQLFGGKAMLSLLMAFIVFELWMTFSG